MFGIGMPELMLIFVLALLVFGPKELPKIARTVGKAMGELRRASDELRDGIQREIDLAEREEQATASSSETVPVTPAAEMTTTPSHDEGASQAPATETTEAGAAPSEPVADAPPAEPSAPAAEGQAGEVKTEECVAGNASAIEQEAGEARTAPEEPREPSTQAQTASSAPAQPVETRNA